MRRSSRDDEDENEPEDDEEEGPGLRDRVEDWLEDHPRTKVAMLLGGSALGIYYLWTKSKIPLKIGGTWFYPPRPPPTPAESPYITLARTHPPDLINEGVARFEEIRRQARSGYRGRF